MIKESGLKIFPYGKFPPSDTTKLTCADGLDEAAAKAVSEAK